MDNVDDVSSLLSSKAGEDSRNIMFVGRVASVGSIEA